MKCGSATVKGKPSVCPCAPVPALRGRGSMSLPRLARPQPRPAGSTVSSAERCDCPRDSISCRVALPSLDITENRRRRQGRAPTREECRMENHLSLSLCPSPRIYKETPTRPLCLLPRHAKQTSKRASDTSFTHLFTTHEAPPLRAELCPAPPIRRI